MSALAAFALFYTRDLTTALIAGGLAAFFMVGILGNVNNASRKAGTDTILRATPVMTTGKGSATVKPVGKELWFVSTRQVKDKPESKIELPLAKVEEFTLGTNDESYGNAYDRAARNISHDAVTYAIYVPASGNGVIPVAEDGGSKAGIAMLHDKLVTEFIVKRRDLQKKLDDQWRR